MERLKDVNVHITVGSIITVFLFLGLFTLLWVLRDLVLIVVTAVVIASAMEPAVRTFMRWGLHRVLSVIAIYAIVASVLSAIVFFFLPPLLEDAANFLASLPQALSSFNFSQATGGLLPSWSQVSTELSSPDFLRNLSSTVGESTGGFFTTLSAFFGGITSFILIVVFSFYFSVQETGVDDFLRVVTPIKEQAYVLHLWKRSQAKIGKWMQGQLILGVIVAVLLYPGLVLLDVPNPLLLAVLAGFFELIPVFGQILAAVPALALAFVDGGLTAALLVAGLYIIVQQFEAHLIYPVVVKKVVGVPPLMVILALLIGAKLAGFLGILLSVPIAAAIQEFLSDVDREKTRALAKAGLTPEGDPV